MRRTSKRPAAASSKLVFLVSLLVIALATVIAVQCGSVPAQEAPTQEATREKQQAEAPKAPLEAVEAKSDAVHMPADKLNQQSSDFLKSSLASEVDSSQSVAAGKRKGRSESVPAETPSEPAKSSIEGAEAAKQEPAAAPVTPVDKAAASPASPATATEKAAADKVSPKADVAAAASSATKPKASKQPQQQLSGKSGAGQKSKLPANLGTVTSTGSGGPAHYMSKHDAYSAIAEKHGALAHDAITRKADKRGSHAHGGSGSGFGGIQKASGLTDALNPFKTVTDSGLARTLGASMRSIMKSKYSVPAYVASALLGAVALLAFYESPISPLPVPALPEPPIGRFPPEMPNISPNVQVPFRVNQQQQQQQQYGYNQRSSNVPQQASSYMGQQQQQQQQQPQQQILFPGNNINSNNNNQPLQRLGMQAMPSGPTQAAPSGPVQLAASLLSGAVGKQQNAQRKSSPDYDQSSSRSFFGSSAAAAPSAPKLGAPVNQQRQQGAGSSILSFFGLGGASGSSEATTLPQSMSMVGNLIPSQVSASLMPMMAAVVAESKGSQSGQGVGGLLSNSHLVNKVRSYFVRSSSPTGSSSGAGVSNSNNQYDQYQRMSFVQALMKDTAFLPGFLSPNRKSSQSAQATSTSTGQQATMGDASKIQSGSGNQAGANPAPVIPQAAARMQGGGDIQFAGGMSQYNSAVAAASKQQQQQQPKPVAASSSGGYGLGRIAHALLETFTSGVSQRSALPAAAADSVAARKSGDEPSQLQPLAASATSLLSDIMSSYGANIAGEHQSHEQPQQNQQQQQQAATKSASPSHQEQPQSSQQQQQHQQAASMTDGQASGRSAEASAPVVVVASSATDELHSHHAEKQQQPKQPHQQVSAAASSSSSVTGKQQAASAAAVVEPSSSHVRKTRSIGFEYPVELAQPREQQPSKAAQINNVIDFVADSYAQNRLLFNFVMNQVGLSQAVPYVEQILSSGPSSSEH